MRRLRNREAASRYRQRILTRIQTLQQQLLEQHVENNRWRGEEQMLRRQVAELKHVLRNGVADGCAVSRDRSRHNLSRVMDGAI